MLIRSALGAADKRRIQAMLFANNGGSGLRQALLDGAPFLAELTHSLVLQRGTGSPTFTRASTATVMGYGPTANPGDAAILLTVAANEARFEGARRISEGVWSNTFADGSLMPAATNTGYLAEGARTNLCLQSGFASGWSGNDATVTLNNAVAPDGTTTAALVAAAATTAGHNVALGSAATVVAGSTYTQSVYLKAGTARYISMRVVTGSGTRGWATLDTQTGASQTNAAVTSATAQMLANSWYRFSVVYVAPLSASDAFVIAASDVATAPSTATVAGNSYLGAGETFYAWGAQVELGSFASSYIATTTAAVTRAADVDANPTASNILAAASTVYLEFTPDHTPSGTIALWGTYVDASNYTAILHDATNLIFRKRIAGSNYDATIANAFTSGTTYKMTASWGAGGSTIYLNGVAGTPHANTTAAQIAATMQFGADGNSLQQPGAAVIKNYIWQRQLSGSEQAAVTA